MKKMILGIATLFLSLGLFAGCENEEVDDPGVGPSNEPSDTTTGETSDPTLTLTATGLEGKLGLFQSTLKTYYYWTGEINDRNFGTMSKDFDEGITVKEYKDENNSYYLEVTINNQNQYLAWTEDGHSTITLSSDPYALKWDTTYETYVTSDRSRFIGNYSSYDMLSWNDYSYIAVSGENLAKIYTEAQENPAADEPDLSQLEKGESGDETYPVSLKYSYQLTASNLGSTSETKDVVLGAFTWSYSPAPYWGYDSNSSARGVQIGSGNNPATDGVTISTDFGEEVKLVSYTINCSVASSGAGSVTTKLDETEVSTITLDSSNTSATDYTTTNLELTGKSLSINYLATAAKAMYLKAIAFEIYVTNDSALLV